MYLCNINSSLLFLPAIRLKSVTLPDPLNSCLWLVEKGDPIFLLVDLLYKQFWLVAHCCLAFLLVENLSFLKRDLGLRTCFWSLDYRACILYFQKSQSIKRGWTAQYNREGGVWASKPRREWEREPGGSLSTRIHPLIPVRLSVVFEPCIGMISGELVSLDSGYHQPNTFISYNNKMNMNVSPNPLGTVYATKRRRRSNKR